jgi:cation transport regulator ChaB
MPHASNADLPPSVRDHLPPHAQDIFREAFNHAWRTYGSARRRSACLNILLETGKVFTAHRSEESWSTAALV